MQNWLHVDEFYKTFDFDSSFSSKAFKQYFIAFYSLLCPHLFLYTEPNKSFYNDSMLSKTFDERIPERASEGRTRSERQPARPLCWPLSGLETHCSASQFQKASPLPNNHRHRTTAQEATGLSPVRERGGGTEQREAAVQARGCRGDCTSCGAAR